MTQGRHRRNQRRASVVAVVLAAAASLILVAAQFLGGASAQATGGSKTVDITVNVPAMVIDNLCNGDTVNLSGDMRIITTTTPRSNGATPSPRPRSLRACRANGYAPACHRVSRRRCE